MEYYVYHLTKSNKWEVVATYCDLQSAEHFAQTNTGINLVVECKNISKWNNGEKTISYNY